jgi:hypothetical protein
MLSSELQFFKDFWTVRMDLIGDFNLILELKRLSSLLENGNSLYEKQYEI